MRCDNGILIYEGKDSRSGCLLGEYRRCIRGWVFFLFNQSSSALPYLLFCLVLCSLCGVASFSGVFMHPSSCNHTFQPCVISSLNVHSALVALVIIQTSRMMEPQGQSKELRNQQSQAVRAKAPVAAGFEDCLQAFDRLSAAIDANRDDFQDEYILSEDCYSRVKTWGCDSGASTRALDHALRKSPQLKSSTLDLLLDLYSILQDGKQKVEVVQSSGLF